MTDWQVRRLRHLMEFGKKIFRHDDPEHELIDVDDNFCNMLGFSRAELFIHCRNKAMELIYPPDLPEMRKEAVEQVERTGEFICRYRMRRKDGVLIWVWENGTVEKDADGHENVSCVVVNISDVEGIRRERDTTYDNIPGGVMNLLITGSNFYVTKANNQYFKMLGVQREEYLGSSGIYTFPEDLPKLRSCIVESAEKKQPIEHEFRIQSGPEQEMRWFRVLGRYYDDVEDGREYLCIIIDITERKQSVFQLEREKERYRIAMGVMANFLFEYNMEKKQLHLYQDANDCEYRLNIEENCKGNWIRLFKCNEFLFYEDFEQIRKIQKAPISFSCEMRLLTVDKKEEKKTYRWFQLEITKMWENNQISRVIGSLKDIEEQKEKEAKDIELRTIYEQQSNKIYEYIFCVDTRNGEMKGFCTGDRLFTDYYKEDCYEDFVEWVAGQVVHPDEKELFMHSLNLEHMKEILNFSETEEVLFFQIQHHKSEYRHKCIRYSFLGNNVNTIVISVQDVHQLREEQLKMEDANRKILVNALNEAQNTVQTRKNFLAMLTRELRMPLQVIGSNLRNKGRVLPGFEEMHDATEYIMSVIDNISEYEKLEQGQFESKNKQIDLYEMLHACMEEWKKKAKRDHIIIKENFNFNWTIFYGDEMRMSQLVNYVMGNCIRFAPENSEIQVWGTNEDQGRGISKLSLVIEDSGVAIDENFYERIYAVHVKGKDEMWKLQKEKIGTNFSLVIAKKIAELLGGRFHLSRKNDQINVLEIEIPLQRLQNLPQDVDLKLPEEKRADAVDLTGYSLLLVERNEYGNKLTGPLLRLNGARVDMANSGNEGITLWNSYPNGVFHAILVGGRLTDMDYLEFTEKVRAQKKYSADTIPILAIVDDVRQDSVRDGMRIGVNAILNKPIDLKRLKQVLDLINFEPAKGKPVD